MEEGLVKLSYITSMLKKETDCAICLQTLKDPVTTKCMHNFCNGCLSRYMVGKKSTICPLCNSPLSRRGTATNTKIDRIATKINPIIELIKNESSVDILSHYKGKVTPSLADGATKMGSSADLAEINSKGVEKSHPHSTSVSNKKNPPANISKSQGLRISNACVLSVSPKEKEQDSFNNYDSFCEVEHLSASQNVQKSHSRKPSVDIPVSGIVKSPAKKVKEWLSKNSTKDCSSLDVDGLMHEVPVNVITEEVNGENYSKREADATKYELNVNRTFGGRPRRKVYKGIKQSKLDSKNHSDMLNKSRMSIESDFELSIEEKDIILDSCPVEINDTFDKLLSSSRLKASVDTLHSFTEENENQNDSVGLFESLPMPAINASKRKRNSKKLKLDISENLISGLNSEKNANQKGNIKRCTRRSGCAEVGNFTTNESIKEIVEEVANEKSSNNSLNKVSSISCEETMKEGNMSINFDRSITDHSNTSVVKSGKRRSDISTPKWPHFDTTLKDFQESRKAMLPVLDVSIGDPQKASKNQQKLKKPSGSLEKDSCDQLADEFESNCVQSGISGEVIPPKSTVDAKKVPEVISLGKLDSSFVSALGKFSHPRKRKKSNITVSSSATPEKETTLSNSKKKVNFDCVEVISANDSFNDSQEKINMSKTSGKSPNKAKAGNPHMMSANDSFDYTGEHINMSKTSGKSPKKTKAGNPHMMSANDSFDYTDENINMSKTSGKSPKKTKAGNPHMMSANNSFDYTGEHINMSKTSGKSPKKTKAGNPHMMSANDSLDYCHENINMSKTRGKSPKNTKTGNRHVMSVNDSFEYTDENINMSKTRGKSPKKTKAGNPHVMSANDSLDYAHGNINMSKTSGKSPKKTKAGNPHVMSVNDSFEYVNENINMSKTSCESPKNKGGDPQKGIMTIDVQTSGKKLSFSVKLEEDQANSSIHRKVLWSPLKKCTGTAEIAATEIVENQMIAKPRSLVPFFKLRRLCDKKYQGPRVKFLMLGRTRHFDSLKQMHDASIITEPCTSLITRSPLDLNSIGIQTEPKEEVEIISDGPELRNGSMNTASCEFEASYNSSSSVKLRKILANVNSDLQGHNEKEQDQVLSDEIYVIPETTTPGYVGESDLSDNETNDKKEDKMDVDVQIISDEKVASDEDSDCIVEGSQKNNISLERPLIKAKPISLVTSALVRREVALVEQFAETFNLHFSPKLNGFENSSGIPITTHVVSKEDAGGKTFFTFKYYSGMVSGCWIVSLKWVIDSLAANKILDEKPYEFLDVCGNSKTHREHNGPNMLFKDFHFLYKEPFSAITVQQLKDVILLGGGNIYGPESKPPEINGKYLAIADGSSVDSSSGFGKFMFLQNIAVVPCVWVLECIEEFRILPIPNYVLNIDSESEVEVCEKLLEMGYDKDLVTIEE